MSEVEEEKCGLAVVCGSTGVDLEVVALQRVGERLAWGFPDLMAFLLFDDVDSASAVLNDLPDTPEGYENKTKARVVDATIFTCNACGGRFTDLSPCDGASYEGYGLCFFCRCALHD